MQGTFTAEPPTAATTFTLTSGPTPNDDDVHDERDGRSRHRNGCRRGANHYASVYRYERGEHDVVFDEFHASVGDWNFQCRADVHDATDDYRHGRIEYADSDDECDRPERGRNILAA